MSSHRAAVMIGALGILILVLGYLHLYGVTAENVVLDLYANFGAEFIGIAITVLVIDFLNQLRQEQELKRQLIRDMGSEVNIFAVRAVRELKAHGGKPNSWLKDGTLCNALLLGANLSGAPLEGANLCGADLTGAVLREAFLVDAQLRKAILRFADLSDADLEAADLSEADLSGAVLRRTNLKEADMREANIEDAIIDGVIHDSGTRWPAGFDPSVLQGVGSVRDSGDAQEGNHARSRKD